MRDAISRFKINYLVKQTEGDWKVYDVTVDDISITANYRNQFTRMIDQQGFDDLMSAMRKNQEELRAARSSPAPPCLEFL